MDNNATEKKERLLAALDKGMVMVHLDARRPGVLVPPSLREEAHLRLNLSYRFDPPDLSVNDWGVRSTLSFSGSRFTVAIPWSALFAITSYATKESWTYAEDLPAELLQTLAPPPPPERPVATVFTRTKLREVVLEHAEGVTAPATPSAAPASAPVAVPLPAPVPALARAESPRAEESPSPSAAGAAASSEDGSPKPRGRGHLRVVK